MRVCKVLKSGLQSIVQDLGRHGHYSVGIPGSGAFDRVALKLGNKALGNPLEAAGLEVLWVGLSLEFLAETWIVITGGDLGPTIDQRAVPMWQVLQVYPGQTLTFSKRKTGLRSYLLFAGGLDVPSFLGSRSTYLLLDKGGYNDRKLESGDILDTFDSPRSRPCIRIPAGLRPNYGSPWRLRVVCGLQYHFFTDESLKRFESADWKVTPQIDRMGLRLEGPNLEYKEPSGSQIRRLGGRDPSNIVTEGNPLGAIQCPAGTKLIIIGPDGPCEGGYAKLGAVISADFSLLAQIMPGDIVRFESVSIEEAYNELHRQNKTFDEKFETIEI